MAGADLQRYAETAAEILQLANAQIMVELRFFSEAAGQLPQRPVQNGPLLATDGESLYYDPVQVVRAFAACGAAVNRGVLHSLLHCLLGHPFERQPKSRQWWDLACDMTVEGVISELELPMLAVPDEGKLIADYRRLTDYAGGSAAQALYNYFVAHPPAGEEYLRLRGLFARDDHGLWYTVERGGARPPQNGEWQPAPEQRQDDTSDEDDIELPPPSGMEPPPEEAAVARRRKKWKRLARQAEADLETFHRQRSKRSGNLLANLKPVTFEVVDYSDFLRRFGTKNEVLHLSEDEFDPVYYTYGLELYGNVPLVEPLEMRDEDRIREFVIAIDTSGSVQGELVQTFLQRTCNVLRQTGTFTSQVKIYLMQCDCAVQSITELNTPEDLERVLPQMDLRGFGGTDFRPVFEAVDALLAEKKLQNLDGLLYFTDGVGTYPEEQPPYKTAFIFHRDDYISPNVPPWAIRAVLTTDAIQVMKER